MTKLNGFLIASALCVAALPASAQQAQVQAAPQAQRVQVQQTPSPTPAPNTTDSATTNAVLSATQTWRPVATDLRAGGRLQINAAGQWRVNPQINRNTDVAVLRQLAQDAGPDGYVDLPRSDSVILPSAPVAALIGRIGETGEPFLIGSQYDQPISSDGTLFVTINDAPGQFADNSGRISIGISVAAPPRPPETPPEQTPPQLTPQEPAVVPLEPPRPDQPGLSPGLVQAALIGVAVLAALLLLSAMFRRPRGGDDRRNPAVPQVTTRVVSDGVAGQSLTLTMRGRR